MLLRPTARHYRVQFDNLKTAFHFQFAYFFWICFQKFSSLSKLSVEFVRHQRLRQLLKVKFEERSNGWCVGQIKLRQLAFIDHNKTIFLIYNSNKYMRTKQDYKIIIRAVHIADIIIIELIKQPIVNRVSPEAKQWR